MAMPTTAMRSNVSMATQTNKALVARFVDEAFVRQDAEAAAALVAANFHSHAWAAFGIPDGPEGVRQFTAALGAAFSNPQVRIEDCIAEDDKVVVRYVYEADHTGELLGIPASGTRVRIPGIFIVRIAAGTIAEYWRQEDLQELLR